MLRYIFRKRKQKERLWTEPKDKVVNGVLMDGVYCRDSYDLPGPASPSDTGTETTDDEDPAYSTIGDLAGTRAWSTFREPYSSEEGGVGEPATHLSSSDPPTSAEKRTSIICVESDEVLTLEPEDLYATVQKPKQADKSQHSKSVSDSVTAKNKNTVKASGKMQNMMSWDEGNNTKATAPEGGNQGADPEELSGDGFNFSISLMDELLADFQKFEELSLPELDELLAPEPIRTTNTTRPLSQVADTFRSSEILKEVPEVGQLGGVNSKPSALLEALVDVNILKPNNSPTLRKTVTFDDNIQHFDRPHSFITESDCTLEDTSVKEPLAEQPQTESIEPKSLTVNGTIPKGAYYEMDDEILTITVPNSSSLPPDNVSLDCLSVATDDDAYSDDEKDEPIRKPIIIRRFRGLRITLIILVWLLLGVGCELSTVSLGRYSTGLNSTFEELGRAYAAESIGLVGGALFTGIVCSYIQGYPDAAILVTLATAIASLVTRPWARRLLYFACNMTGIGFAKGVLFVGGASYVAKIQDENKCTVLMYIAFSMYNLGALCACQLVLIFTKVVFPPEVVYYLQRLGFPRKQNVLLYSNGNSTVDTEVASKVRSDESVFPWDVGGLLCMLLVGMCMILVGLAFLCLMTYTLIQAHRKRKREELIHIREREKFRKNIQLMGHVKHSDTQPKNRGNFSSPTPIPLLHNPDPNDTHSYNDSGFNKHDDYPDHNTETALRNGIVPRPILTNTISNGIHATHGESLSKNTGNSKRCTSSSVPIRGNCHGLKVEAYPEARKTVSFDVKKKKKRVRWFLGDQSFDIPMLMYLYVFFTLALGSEMVIGRYFYEFITNTTKLDISQKEATCLMMAFWGAGAVSRMLSLPVSRLFSPNAVMITCLTLSLVGLVVLAIYGSRYHIILWMFTALTGFAFGPILPGGLTFANIYLNLVPKTIALAFTMAGLGAALFVWLGGLVLDYFGYTAMLFLSVGMACLSALLFTPVLFNLTRKKIFRFKTPKTVEDFVTRKPSVTYL